MGKTVPGRSRWAHTFALESPMCCGVNVLGGLAWMTTAGGFAATFYVREQWFEDVQCKLVGPPVDMKAV